VDSRIQRLNCKGCAMPAVREGHVRSATLLGVWRPDRQHAPLCYFDDVLSMS
jgi:hypothetical protein